MTKTEERIIKWVVRESGMDYCSRCCNREKCDNGYVANAKECIEGIYEYNKKCEI